MDRFPRPPPTGSVCCDSRVSTSDEASELDAGDAASEGAAGAGVPVAVGAAAEALEASA